MKQETMDFKIKCRAGEIARKKIKYFRDRMLKEVNTLVGDMWSTEAKQCFAVMASEDTTKGWPTSIFQGCEEKLKEEVLSTMDTVQRMLVAKDCDLPVGEIAADA